jgi:hypothetical protein
VASSTVRPALYRYLAHALSISILDLPVSAHPGEVEVDNLERSGTAFENTVEGGGGGQGKEESGEEAVNANGVIRCSRNGFRLYSFII